MRKLTGSSLILLVSATFLTGCEQIPPEVVNNSSSSSVLSSTEGTTQNTVQSQLGDSVKPTMIYFSFDSSELTFEATQELDQALQHLQSNPSKNIVVEGHAEEGGTGEYNLALGAKRALSVADFLVADGIDALRVSQVLLVKEQPIRSGPNEDA